MPVKKNNIAFSLKLVLWSAQTLSLLLFLFWGAFFIEHLQFFTNVNDKPAFIVYLITVFHFMLLVSYIFAMWKHFAGSVMMIIFALAFFVFTAGQMFLPFFLISAIPAGFYLYYWQNTKVIKKPIEQENQNE
jgi:hypothetical protein